MISQLDWRQIVTRLSGTGQLVWERLKRLDKRSGGWPSLLLQSGHDVLTFRFSLISAAVGYFTLFSIFPLILLTVAVASISLDPFPTITDSELHQLVNRFEFVVPAINDLLGANLERIERNRGAITGFSAVSLLWSASSVFYVLTRALDGIWSAGSNRPAWRHRAVAITLVMVFSVVLWTVSVAGSAAATLLFRLLPGFLSDHFVYLGFLGTAGLSVAVFAMLYYFLPHMRMSWHDIIWGAIIAGVLWEVAKRAFFFFVTHYLSLSNLVYGSVTAIIAFLAWSYASTLIFLFGAHVNVKLRRRLSTRQ